MSKKKVIISGCSGHAKVIIDIFEKEGEYEILGLLDVQLSKGEEFFGYQVLGKESDIPEIIKNEPETAFFIAIGDNWRRSQVKHIITAIHPGAKFASTIHPSAQIGKNTKIGNGVAIMAGAIINPDSQIGDFTIINTNASIDHDCKMRDFSSIAPGAVTGGNVEIGEFSAISIGASVVHNVKIGKHSIIGAGAVITKDCSDQKIVLGVPGKEIRDREIGEPYL